MDSKDTFTHVAEKLQSGSVVSGLGEVAMTAASFMTPPAERLYRTIRSGYNHPPLSMQPAVSVVGQQCLHVLNESYVTAASSLDLIQQTRLINTMFQFSDRTPTIRQAMATPYATVSELYDQVVESAMPSQPVTYAELFAFSMEQSQNNIPSALWNLMITGRQYARWRDSGCIDDLPTFTRQQKLDRMALWERSIAASKPPTSTGYQDTSGDNYYVWTHALARTIYDGMASPSNVLSRSYNTAFEYGSHVMGLSRKLGVISVFGTMSDHLPASQYGNSIGQLCADAVKTLRSDTV